MPQLARVLKLPDLTLLVIGSVIGSGIFLVPGGVLKTLDHSVGLALGVWCVGGVLSLLGALTYGELAAASPEVGGLYVYLRDGLGRLPAFLYGWVLFWVINTGSVATLSVAFADTLAQVEPRLGPGKVAIAIAVIAVLTLVNVRGTRHSANLQNWTTFVKVGALLLMSIVLLILGRNLGSPPPPPAAAAATGLGLASALGVAMISVLWAYEGWQIVTFSAGETVDAHRTFPRAFLVGTLALIGIYLLANVAYLAALGPTELAGTANAASASLRATVGPWAERGITLAILISMFGAANSNLLTGPRVFYAMAHDGLFFKRFTEVHANFGTPAIAVVAGAVWSALLVAMMNQFEKLLTYVVFAAWIFYGLGALTVFVYRKRLPAESLPYRTPGYPLTPILFILGAAALVVNTLVTKTEEALLGLAFLAAGVPVYFIWQGVVRRSAGR